MCSIWVILKLKLKEVIETSIFILTLISVDFTKHFLKRRSLFFCFSYTAHYPGIGVNFVNILHAAFSWESFFELRVCVCIFFVEMKLAIKFLIKCWRNRLWDRSWFLSAKLKIKDKPDKTVYDINIIHFLTINKI